MSTSTTINNIGPLSALILVLGLSFTPGAFAFVEDVCYYYTKDKPLPGNTPVYPRPFNCLDLQCDDGADSGDLRPQCFVSGITTFIRAVVLPGTPAAQVQPADRFHVRSTIHFDFTWLAARLAGLKPKDADTVAAYSEAADLAEYYRHDYQGKPIAGSQTMNLAGGVRTNQDTFGYWMHFTPWLKTDPAMSTAPPLRYHPKPPAQSPFAEHEIALNHLRAWAFGQRKTICEFAMTKDVSKIDAPCYEPQDKKSMKVFDPLIGGATNTDSKIQQSSAILSWQRVSPKPRCKAKIANSYQCYRQDFAANHAGSLKALGIYIHALADRVSHHYCVKGAAIMPDPSNQFDYQLAYPSQCGPVGDVRTHNLELGNVNTPQRTYDGVEFITKELAAWVKATDYKAAKRPQVNPNFPDPHDTEAMLRMFGNALSQDDAQERITSLCEISVRGYRLGWHDGSTACQYPTGD